MFLLPIQGVKWLEYMIPRVLPWAKRQAELSARIRSFAIMRRAPKEG